MQWRGVKGLSAGMTVWNKELREGSQCRGNGRKAGLETRNERRALGVKRN